MHVPVFHDFLIESHEQKIQSIQLILPVVVKRRSRHKRDRSEVYPACPVAPEDGTGVKPICLTV
ncbi:MAG: hypothetical protein B6I30_09630 [Desulfobacteraceae bacterium 4572_187]|nr:MAG: hypothetical protein B6I30_09630 [Desulfobacteraceae bacterium 4572_187]